MIKRKLINKKPEGFIIRKVKNTITYKGKTIKIIHKKRSRITT